LIGGLVIFGVAFGLASIDAGLAFARCGVTADRTPLLVPAVALTAVGAALPAFDAVRQKDLDALSRVAAYVVLANATAALLWGLLGLTQKIFLCST